MEKQAAVRMVRETFENPFDKGRFRVFARNLFNHMDEADSFVYKGNYVPDAYEGCVSTLERVGKYEDGDGNKIDILVVQLKKETSLERARTMQRNFVAWYLNGSRGGELKDAAMAAFVAPDEEDWRFSLVKMDYHLAKTESGKTKAEKELTPARRWSFLVGRNESSHTAQRQLLPILETEKDPSLADLEKAFNIEVVTREFFGKYRELFHNVRDALEAIREKDAAVQKDFTGKGVDTASFAKKLLGQIVFLYFLQKKGWFGVSRDGKWGTGPRDFLRRLFGMKVVKYGNFFNDVLEPLFYNTLAVERTEDFSDRFNCRIPFLNGGLFDPMNGYDWVHTDILLPNVLFSNGDKTKEGDEGTGILDVFDRYNFTVREDEPLEKEVAIDPEMLGKVFENLLEVRDRKSKGTYYTPREIVHYMCQESLVSYLDTAINTGEAPLVQVKPPQGKLFGAPDPQQAALRTAAYTEIVPRKDLEEFIHKGELAIENDARVETKGRETGRYSYRLPESIRLNARLIDDRLKDIRVCDPAIGSGAFPVGIMTEIVRARNVLTTYVGDGDRDRDRDNYPVPQAEAWGIGDGPNPLRQAQGGARPLPDTGRGDRDRWGNHRGITPTGGGDTGRGDERTNYNFKRHAIQNCLYGVDIDPGAVEIAKLRLWLSLVVDEEDIKQIQPLPNLDYKIVCGNSLLEVDLFDLERMKELEGIKLGYFQETNAKKKLVLKDRINNVIKEVTRDNRSFDFRVYFSEVFREKGGFDVVIANPPYDVVSDARLRRAFAETVYGRANLYGLFMHRAIRDVLKQNGYLTFINPKTLLCDAYFTNLRKYLRSNGDFIEIIKIVDRHNIFDEVLQACIIVMYKKGTPQLNHNVMVSEIGERKDIGNHASSLIIAKENIYQRDQFDGCFFCSGKKESYYIWRKVRDSTKALSFFGFSFTTGKIQWDLFKDKLIGTPRKGAVRLIWAENIQRYYFGSTAKRTGKEYLMEPPARSSITSDTIIAQRTTADEQEYRIIATMFSPRTHGFYAFCENHTNYLEKMSAKFHLNYVLACLNSKLYDFIFRHLSSNTQVSSGQLNSLPFRDLRLSEQAPFIRLVDQVFAITKDEDYISNQAKQAKVKELERQIDQMVYKLYGLTEEEIRVVEGKT